MEYQTYSAKKILNVHKHPDGGWFWVKYSAYPYLGCYFGCEYCYERDEKYLPYKGHPEQFNRLVKVKENAPALLEKELKKVAPDLIAVGDWQPAEKKYRLSRKMLEICYQHKFPVFILEKSPLILEDLDLLKKINKKTGAVTGFSIITTKDDQTRRIFEPKAPATKARFLAMKKIAQAGILTGTSFMPILPFIYDDEDNLEAVVKATKLAGGSYVLAGGLTLWGGVQPHFFGVLKKNFPDLLPKYQKLFASEKEFGNYWLKISGQVRKLCQKHGLSYYIPRPVKHYPAKLLLNKEVAAKFYQRARDIQESGENRYKEWAYRKAAWAIDDLNESLADIYKKGWLVGLQKIEGIGNRLAHEIEKEIRKLAS
ncbi:MAG: radical SAM protein [Candidatus Kerfeldbacteria bacterium CG_4_10_14_0_8_um_filter_42_10]|uniref:Radical SAM protein n=1 Tax=Candidatus Kerfeldbacteria bacterium CG_4_10_14_0_8_um_filter_42_10 TaxID=2014248 RepID=A0A2M7RKX3_9BACT|nr:MAG: radical SAM protein [Candidatus Kerfeldbacteria bacterium CG_4_10_14_0_8_um_filter_42_10]